MNLAAFTLVMASWFGFAAVFLVQRAQMAAGGTTARRDPRSLIGLALQGASFFVVWSMRRNPQLALLDGGPLLEGVLAAAAALLAVSSVALALVAVRTLGKEWSLAARTLEGHRLVREGPYAHVRHPIYTAMLGMMLATALVNARPLALALGLVLFLAGTHIRTHSEEALLRAQFGEELEEYRRRVPALLPWPFGR